MQQIERKIGRFDAHVFLLILEGDVVHTIATGAARLAEGDGNTGGVLHLDHDVFKDMTEPRAFVFGHPSDESARLTVAAAVFFQAWQAFDESVDE